MIINPIEKVKEPIKVITEFLAKEGHDGDMIIITASGAFVCDSRTIELD